MLGPLFLSHLLELKISFHDSGQNLGNSTSSKVVLGDIDNDGDLDAIVSNWNHQFTQNSKIWFNDGEGIFSESTQTMPPSLANSSLGDIDGDGDLDVWITGGVWINDGNGHFTQTGSYYMDGFSVLGDLDADGDLDVFITNFDANMNRVYLNDGEGIFYDTDQELGHYQSGGVALGDVDGDGDSDAFIANSGIFDGGHPNKVWLNDSGVEDEELQPEHVALEQNYPNPFKSSTLIRYSVVETALVRLSIFDVRRRRIMILVNEFQELGNYSVPFNALDEYGNKLSSGIYIYQISIGDIKKQRRMLLLQ